MPSYTWMSLTGERQRAEYDEGMRGAGNYFTQDSAARQLIAMDRRIKELEKQIAELCPEVKP